MKVVYIEFPDECKDIEKIYYPELDIKYINLFPFSHAQTFREQKQPVRE